MTLPSVPDVDCHNVTLCHTPQDRLCTHARSYSVSGRLVIKWCIISSYHQATPSLQTCTRSNCNGCNMHCSRRNQQLIARMCCSFTTMQTTHGKKDRGYHSVTWLGDIEPSTILARPSTNRLSPVSSPGQLLPWKILRR